VLVIGAETFSRLMDWTDRGTCVLFGDGAGALVLEAATGTGTTADRGILSTDLNSDGPHKDILYVDGGTSTGTTGHLRMEGKEVFRHAVEKLAETAHTALDKVGPDRRAMSTGSCRIRPISASSKAPPSDAGADGPRRRHRAGPRQHLGRVDSRWRCRSAGARPDQARRSDRDRGDRRRSGLGCGRPALVSLAQEPPTRLQLRVPSC
jgi:hypothetical protein